MGALPTLSTLWIGGALGWLERLCLTSMLHHGHEVNLYSYSDVSNVPTGVIQRDARDIWDYPAALLKQTAPSFIADIFRVYLMHKSDEVWVDTDILCLKPLDLDKDGYLIGRTPWDAEINNAVMRLPKGSPALDLITSYIEDASQHPTWLRPALRQRIERYSGDDRLAFLFNTKRTILGPRALTHCLKKTAEQDHALEPDYLYPVPWQFAQVLFNPYGGHDGWITDRTKAVHLWSNVLKWHRNAGPQRGSFLDLAADEFGFEKSWQKQKSPQSAVAATPASQQSKAGDKAQQDLVNSSTRPSVASLWIGPNLTFIEQLCLKSFADHQHTTTLYCYDEVAGVPPGIECRDASEILPSSPLYLHGGSGKPGPHADKFRYHLMMKKPDIWVDTDAFCRAPFPQSDYLFACHWKDMAANGVLRLPRSSATLADLIRFTDNDFPDLASDFPFKNASIRDTYFARKSDGRPMHVSELWWEIWGPHPMTYYLNKNGEMARKVPAHQLYPFDGGDMRALFRPFDEVESKLKPDCISVHLFGSAVGRLLARHGGIPPKGCYLEKICHMHDVDPASAPVPTDSMRIRN